MAEENLFDVAWDEWRRDLTESLTPSSELGVSEPMWQALHNVGAFDAADGCIRRDWALGLMTGENAYRHPLLASGMRDDDVRALVACIQRHPVPAAGG